MAGNIFINYRRDESGHVAGRLHDSLAPTFGRNKLFMDVDNIPVGRDFEEYLKSQVAACDAMLAVIGPNWLAAKDDTGKRRLDNPDDFIVIEIGTALTRNIPVVPVLVDGARMPKASELPDSLKLLARRQAIQVRHTNFRSDAEALVKRLREAVGHDLPERGRRVWLAIGVAVVAVLLLIGVGGYAVVQRTYTTVEKTAQQREAVRAEQAEQQRLAAAEKDPRAKAEADANRKAEAERQRKEGETAGRAGDYDKAMANFNEAIRLNQNDAVAFYDRGLVYSQKGDNDRAIADYNEAIRLDPKNALAYFARGFIYGNKGDTDRAMADLNETIRLNPMQSIAFNNRGFIYESKGDYDRAMAEYNKSIRLYPLYALAFINRGNTYLKKGDYDRAIADYNEAIRLDPKNAAALCQRGMLKRKIDDSSGNADIAKAKELNASSCS